MSSAGTKLAKQDSTAPQPKLRALLVEDNTLDAALVLRALNKDGFDVTADLVQDEAEFTRALRAHPPEVVLADYNLPTWKGMDALKVLRSEGLDIPMILVSGALGDVTAVECIRQGATDYVLKDGLARLPEVVGKIKAEMSGDEVDMKASGRVKMCEKALIYSLGAQKCRISRCVSL